MSRLRHAVNDSQAEARNWTRMTPVQDQTPMCRTGNTKSARSTRRMGGMSKSAALASILALSPMAMAQDCISLSSSTLCPAFNASSISTDDTLVGLFPFLAYVSSTESFDEQLSSYISTSYVQTKFETLFGCQNIDLTNTTQLYARYTTTVICNAIVQNSRTPCGLTSSQSTPVCADTCAEQAESEAYIVADDSLCSNPDTNNTESQIRADFTVCSLPVDSLSGGCIDGAQNEPDNCGYGNSTIGLCSYCAAGGQNSTDTCCYNSNADEICQNVVLPSITSTVNLTTATATASTTPTSASTSAAAAPSSGGGLSGGAIAGIVIGSIVGAALLAGLLFFLIACIRRRKGSQQGSIFNQPQPSRNASTAQQGMAYNPVTNRTPEGYEVLPGGRIARMSALEGHSGDSPPRGEGIFATGAAAGAAGYAAGRRRGQSASNGYGESPERDARIDALRAPAAGRRTGSLSSNSMLGMDDPSSPSNGEMSSPVGIGSQQSEQLSAFKDYYSQDEIKPGDKVATLWAYQPRAGDEFTLERGDMIKVFGIWDDGWATGVLIPERAEDWDARHNPQRDSGVSHHRDESPAGGSGEIKAFPLVCVCLAEHWRKTIEGDGSTETGSSAPLS